MRYTPRDTSCNSATHLLGFWVFVLSACRGEETRGHRAETLMTFNAQWMLRDSSSCVTEGPDLQSLTWRSRASVESLPWGFTAGWRSGERSPFPRPAGVEHRGSWSLACAVTVRLCDANTRSSRLHLAASGAAACSCLDFLKPHSRSSSCSFIEFVLRSMRSRRTSRVSILPEGNVSQAARFLETTRFTKASGEPRSR